MVTASETSGYKRLNESRIKALTGGDAITARHLYESEQTFTPEFTLWLSTNDKPRIHDHSDGFWRRLRLIPFTQKFEGENDDKELEGKLLTEAAGILAWAIDACLEYQVTGLNEVPESVRAATEAYRQESDPLADFLSEKCETGGGLEAQATILFRTYAYWAEDQGMKGKEVLSRTAFGRQIGERFDKRKANAGNVYLGIGVRE